MKRAINRLGDRMLSELLPSTTARAEPCWWKYNPRRWCCIIARITYCRLD
ncbi:hypothetical protein OHR68_05980 [Spirillospora sp. NBC_00431]